MKPIKPVYSQSNFNKLFHEFESLHMFVMAYHKMGIFKHIFFGKRILASYLRRSGILKDRKPAKKENYGK